MAMDRIEHVPSLVLDAPGIVDDFYLNIMDASFSNIAIALGSCAYLVNLEKCSPVRIFSSQDKILTSIRWFNSSYNISIGDSSGCLHIVEASSNANRIIQTHCIDTDRIAATATLFDAVAAGSRDGKITLLDIRMDQALAVMHSAHTQEICGLDFSGHYLASGSNDNKVAIWDVRSTTSPIQIHSNHNAAVKVPDTLTQLIGATMVSRWTTTGYWWRQRR